MHINRHKSYSNSSIFNRVSSATILLLALIAKFISRVCMHQHKFTKPEYISLMHTVCLDSAGLLVQCMSMRLTIEWPVRNGHKNTGKNTAAYDRDIPFNSLIILKGLGEFRIRIRLGAPLRLASFLWRVGCGVELVN